MPTNRDKSREAARTTAAPDTHVVAFSSPACAMSEADDIYMGYAGRGELLASLDELLAAGGDESPDRTALLGHIRALGGTPRTGATRTERGQIVRTLHALLPRVREAALHADLTRILRALEERLGRPPKAQR